MKVLYVAYKHDPRDPMAGSSADYQFVKALKDEGIDVQISGPFVGEIYLPERMARRFYVKLVGRRYAKYPLSRALKTSHSLNRMVASVKPDVIFSLYPPPLVFLRSSTPLLFRTDTTFIGQQREWPLYGNTALKICVWQERRVFRRCSKIVTQSEWSRQVLIGDYGIDPEQIMVFANPAALPNHVVPNELEIVDTKRIDLPIRLLLVGREYKRKGIDVAIETTMRLNNSGIPSHLTICGLSGESTRQVHFAGHFKKSEPSELQAYVNLYRNAHLLLHPARFDASPIVTSEAAAFGTPTITNDSGGLATSVRDGESGIVLPKGSPASKYAESIAELINNRDRYYELCASTRRRYERELNWEAAGKQLAKVIDDVAGKRQPSA